MNSSFEELKSQVVEHLKTPHNETENPQKPFAKLSVKDPANLKDEDLPRYVDYLFERLLGVIASEEYRIEVLDLIDKTNKEAKTRKK